MPVRRLPPHPANIIRVEWGAACPAPGHLPGCVELREVRVRNEWTVHFAGAEVDPAGEEARDERVPLGIHGHALEIHDAVIQSEALRPDGLARAVEFGDEARVV